MSAAGGSDSASGAHADMHSAHSGASAQPRGRKDDDQGRWVKLGSLKTAEIANPYPPNLDPILQEIKREEAMGRDPRYPVPYPYQLDPEWFNNQDATARFARLQNQDNWNYYRHRYTMAEEEYFGSPNCFATLPSVTTTSFFMGTAGGTIFFSLALRSAFIRSPFAGGLRSIHFREARARVAPRIWELSALFGRWGFFLNVWPCLTSMIGMHGFGAVGPCISGGLMFAVEGQRDMFRHMPTKSESARWGVGIRSFFRHFMKGFAILFVLDSLLLFGLRMGEEFQENLGADQYSSEEDLFFNYHPKIMTHHFPNQTPTEENLPYGGTAPLFPGVQEVKVPWKPELVGLDRVAKYWHSAAQAWRTRDHPTPFGLPPSVRLPAPDSSIHPPKPPVGYTFPPAKLFYESAEQ